MGHGCPNTRHEKSMALGRAETAERGSRDRRSDVITKVFRSRTALGLKNEEKNFELYIGYLPLLYFLVLPTKSSQIVDSVRQHSQNHGIVLHYKPEAET